MKRAFKMRYNVFFIIFEGVSLKQIKKLLKGENLILKESIIKKQSLKKEAA